MARKAEYQGISRRARSLLSSSEGIDVDFKETLNGLDASDLTSFANSPTGGAILIGVQESKDKAGLQRGKVIGCSVGDQARLQIINKALACVPPVAVDVIAENTGSTPFLRVEIPSGGEKPYCTPSGTYKIRGDGRNRPMLPQHILSVLMDREAKEFQNRFRTATEGIETSLRQTMGAVDDIEHSIQRGLSEIEDQLGWAVYHADDAESGIRRVSAELDTINERVQRVEQRIIAISTHLKAPDPIKERAKAQLAKEVEQLLRNDLKILKTVAAGKSITLSGGVLSDLTKDESQQVFRDVVAKLIPELPELLKAKEGKGRNQRKRSSTQPES